MSSFIARSANDFSAATAELRGLAAQLIAALNHYRKACDDFDVAASALEEVLAAKGMVVVELANLEAAARVIEHADDVLRRLLVDIGP